MKMASVFKKTMVMLGLVPDDEEIEDEYEYEPYDDTDQDVNEDTYQQVDAPELHKKENIHSLQESAELEPTKRSTERIKIKQSPIQQNVTPLKLTQVNPVSSARTVRPYVIAPKGFPEVQKVADRLIQGQPVIMNLEIVTEETKRRMIDFCSGATYALGGTMEKVGENVFLMTPNNVEISKDVRNHIQRKHFPRG
jgi:cell division inhibitor SepF